MGSISIHYAALSTSGGQTRSGCCLDDIYYCNYNKCVKIEYDPSKRENTLKHRGLDFSRCAEIFAGPHLIIEDDRQNYGETRYITFGFLDGREVVIVWTLRGETRRIISMRKANEREKQRFYNGLE